MTNDNTVIKKIYQLSDLHFADETCQVKTKSDPTTGLKTVIEAIKPQLDSESIIVLTGDLVYDEKKPHLYEKLAQQFNEIKVPIYCIPGNHDSLELMQKHFISEQIRYVDKLVFDNWLILFLDTSTPGEKLGSGRLLKSHLQHLMLTLESHQNKDVCIFMHHPPILFGAQWFQEICLENRDEFQEIVNKFDNVKAVVFGHAHTEYHTHLNGKLYICAPSTWVQFDHRDGVESVYIDDGKVGFEIYQLMSSGDVLFEAAYC